MSNANFNVFCGVTDKYSPEVQAMLAAMYSRNYCSIMDRLPQDQEQEIQIKEKLFKYYNGYGHKSVGQLGSTTIYIEDVSVLAAKAIEDTKLFNGQEPSTRYIDFSTQPMHCADTENNDFILKWQEEFRALYLKALIIVTVKMKELYPFSPGVRDITPEQTSKSKAIWENTIKARVFDVCRGLLPAGIKTNVAFIGTFDNINDHFGSLLYHPSQEMRSIARKVLMQMNEKYPYACEGPEKLHDQMYSNCADNFSLYYQEVFSNRQDNCGVKEFKCNSFENPALNISPYREKFNKFNRSVSSNYQFRFTSVLDYGSYRDIHRHRNGTITMPVLTTNIGFNSFYIDNLLDENLIQEVLTTLNKFEQELYLESDLSSVDLQYCIPMGYNVAFNYTCDLNQLLYMIELRTSKTVHQTLRKLMIEWLNLLRSDNRFSNIHIHADTSDDNFTLKRGTQTFSGGYIK